MQNFGRSCRREVAVRPSLYLEHPPNRAAGIANVRHFRWAFCNVSIKEPESEAAVAGLACGSTPALLAPRWFCGPSLRRSLPINGGNERSSTYFPRKARMFAIAAAPAAADVECAGKICCAAASRRTCSVVSAPNVGSKKEALLRLCCMPLGGITAP